MKTISQYEITRMLDKHKYPKVFIEKLQKGDQVNDQVLSVDKIFIGTRLGLSNNLVGFLDLYYIEPISNTDIKTIEILVSKLSKEILDYKLLDIHSSKNLVIKEEDIVSLFGTIVGKDNIETYTNYLRFKSYNNITNGQQKD